MVIEDDEEITGKIKKCLEDNSFNVYILNDGIEAVETVKDYEPDLVMLDWLLPGKSGIEICNELRKIPSTSSIPILMLSSRGEDFEKVMGLDNGADDYLAKPFNDLELIARIKALLRRIRPIFSETKLKHGSIEIDSKVHKAYYHKMELKLSPIEFQLLQIFLEKPEEIIPKSTIINKIWGAKVYVEERTIDVHIARLRKAISRVSKEKVDHIKTVRSVGYILKSADLHNSHMTTVSVVNAFSDCLESGNLAAVYISDDLPSSYEMQKIATKNNLSETAFLKNINKNQYHIRWFTPNSEAPICIHATLGAAHCLYENNLVNSNDTIEFISLNNKFMASKTFNWINLNAPSIEIMAIQSNKLIDEILKNCNAKYLGLSGNILFVELKDKNEVKNFIPNLNLILKLPYRALLITSRDEQFDFISRYFAPSVGIDEDPVCGSAHCRLIPYWSKKLDKTNMMAYQASKRGGIIKCQNLKNNVIISGKTITVS